MPGPINTTTPHHWRKISKEKEITRPVLVGDIDADVTVIGGGFTALVAAIEFAKAGLRTVVLEQLAIGQGASGRNNGQVVPHHSKASPAEMCEILGKQRGDAYNALVVGGADRVFEHIARYDIQCDGVQRGWIAAAHSQSSLARIRKVSAEWKAFGAPATFLDAEELERRTGTGNYPGGWTMAHGGHLNPYAFALGMARGAEQEGATIYENTGVTRVSADGGGWLVETADASGTKRGRVRSAKIFIATNALTGAFWPNLARALVPVRVFQGATAPISDNIRGTVLPDSPAFGDTRRDIRAYRLDGTGALVTGGTHTLWHDAAERGRKKLARHVYETFPQLLSVPIAEYWEGILAVVPDRLPRIMRLGPNAIFAGVYSGRGVALSQQVGALAARLLLGTQDDATSPVQVTGLREVPSHSIAVQVARFIHPIHRIQDRLDK